MRTNFRKNEDDKKEVNEDVLNSEKELTREEFEEFISKRGAKGSYMVYRSKHKEEEELGIDEI